MARYAIAALIIVALAAGVWWFLGPDQGTDPTVPVADSATTTTTDATTTTVQQSTTTTPDGRVVETVEEAEAILRELWFGWFEGIYIQDEDRIREVVATEEQVEVAREAFGQVFLTAPSLDAIGLTETDILRSDHECLAVWAVLDVTALRGPEAVTARAFILRRLGQDWRILASWTLRDGGWEGDCDASLP